METVDYKFKLGIEVWFIYENKIISGFIQGISIFMRYKELRISYKVSKYTLSGGIIPDSFLQNKLFSSKEELIKSL